MFRFKTEQKIENIAGVMVGGQPGELPTVLAGTIFYENHKIVEDHELGLFDKVEAERLINAQEACSDETGNPHMVHVFATTKAAAINYMDFVTQLTDAPVIIDSTESSVRIEALQYATEMGYADKIVYNSINMSITQAERDALTDSDVTSAIILAFNPVDSSLDGRMALLEDGAGVMDDGLINIAKGCGITDILIDPSITPLGSGAGVALKLTLAAKSRWGYPVGSGIHNAPSSWQWLREKRKDDAEIFKICDIASTAIQQVAGGDFVLYGPIENAPYTFPLAAMTDIMIAEAGSDVDGDVSPQHPINNLV